MLAALSLISPALALVAFAPQAVAVLLAADPTLLETVLKYTLPPLVPLLFASAIAACAKLATYLHAQEKGSKAARVGAIFADLTGAMLQHSQSELGPEIQAAMADGSISPEERAALEKHMLEMVKAHAPADLQAEAAKVFGEGGAAIWLKSLVSSAVSSALPDAAPAATPTSPP